MLKRKLRVTFTGGEVEEEVDNVRAMIVAARGTEVASEARVEKGVRGDTEGVPVEATAFDALLCFNDVL